MKTQTMTLCLGLCLIAAVAQAETKSSGFTLIKQPTPSSVENFSSIDAQAIKTEFQNMMFCRNLPEQIDDLAAIYDSHQENFEDHQYEVATCPAALDLVEATEAAVNETKKYAEACDISSPPVKPVDRACPEDACEAQYWECLDAASLLSATECAAEYIRCNF